MRWRPAGSSWYERDQAVKGPSSEPALQLLASTGPSLRLLHTFQSTRSPDNLSCKTALILATLLATAARLALAAPASDPSDSRIPLERNSFPRVSVEEETSCIAALNPRLKHDALTGSETFGNWEGFGAGSQDRCALGCRDVGSWSTYVLARTGH